MISLPTAGATAGTSMKTIIAKLTIARHLAPRKHVAHHGDRDDARGRDAEALHDAGGQQQFQARRGPGGGGTDGVERRRRR